MTPTGPRRAPSPRARKRNQKPQLTGRYRKQRLSTNFLNYGDIFAVRRSLCRHAQFSGALKGATGCPKDLATTRGFRLGNDGDADWLTSPKGRLTRRYFIVASRIEEPLRLASLPRLRCELVPH
jgi:hypothetical protein